MKLREECTKYSVGKHGKDYIDPEAVVPLCPECQSLNVRIHKAGEVCSGNYICKDCTCEFDQWKGSERTELGEVIGKILIVLMVLSIVVAIVSLIGGIIYAIYLDHIYPDGNCPKELEIKSCIIAVGGLVGGLTATAVFANAEEKI